MKSGFAGQPVFGVSDYFPIHSFQPGLAKEWNSAALQVSAICALLMAVVVVRRVRARS
jgi:hypothetical protein